MTSEGPGNTGEGVRDVRGHTVVLDGGEAGRVELEALRDAGVGSARVQRCDLLQPPQISVWCEGCGCGVRTP